MANPKQYKRVAVIMAGGSGERFWPLSRQNMPKQLLRLTHPENSMLAEAIARITSLIPPEDIYVQTMPNLLEIIRGAGLGIPSENIIAEPCKRNTAGCLCYAVAFLSAKLGENVSMAVLTADHAIGNKDAFGDTAKAAFDVAETRDALVTLGIRPTRPDTGYGYIEAANLDGGVFEVSAFKEKPSLLSAERYLQQGNYYWNSGMFFWRIGVFLDEFKEANPEFYVITQEMIALMNAGDFPAAETRFEDLDSISIDFALMEKSRRVAMLPANFDWEDVGSLLAIERSRIQDDSGNTIQGNPVLVNTSNCIVLNESCGQGIALGVIGMENAVVVVTDDAVLVASKDQVENVRQIVSELRAQKAPQL